MDSPAVVAPEAPAPEGGDPVVRVQSLSKSYGKRVAVDGVSFEVGKGEIYGLIGPDGAGKSSVMKAIAGVLTFDGGELEVFGRRVDSERSAEAVKARLGLMPQGLGLNLYPDLSIEENVDFFARLRSVPWKTLNERKKQLLAMTRLERFKDRPMKQLSGGMKQKLGLVCTLIHEPDLVVLDEPTTGVDPVSRRDFWAILADLLRERGITALVSTAYMDEATRFHRMSLMFDGKVLAQGETSEILAMAPGSAVTFRPSNQASALEQLRKTFQQTDAFGPWVRVFVPNASDAEAPAEVGRALSGGVAPEARTSEPELEDVFIALVEERGLVKDSAGGDVRFEAPPAETDQGIAIKSDGLIRDFGGFRAVDSVSFEVRQGEIFGLLGANGAGKTTVIKMLTGILSPSDGAGLVAGADMRSAAQQIKERIGYMSQAFSLYEDLTVAENIRLYAGVYGLDRRQTRSRLSWIVDMAGLRGHEDDQTGRLPMGLRQRLALGCALVHRPRILFLDEPTSGVDPIGRRRFWEILFRLSREETVAILVTTHYMSEAEHCDHLALMFAGRVVADATPEAMKREVEQEAGGLLELTTSNASLALKTVVEAGLHDAAMFGNRIHLLSRNPDEDRTRLASLLSAQGIDLLRAESLPLTMEDVFVHKVTSLEQESQAKREAIQ